MAGKGKMKQKKFNLIGKYYALQSTKTQKWIYTITAIILLLFVIMLFLYCAFKLYNLERPLIKNFQINYFKYTKGNSSIILEDLNIDYDSTELKKLIINLEEEFISNYFQDEFSEDYFLNPDLEIE